LNGTQGQLLSQHAMPPAKPNRGMVVGHGLDVVDVVEFGRLLSDSAQMFLDRYFTPAELAAAGNGAERTQRLAGRFAVKEAVMKALGTGWGNGVAFTDIEVVTLESGTPTLSLKRLMAEIEHERLISGWLVSTSHTSSVAVASVIAISDYNNQSI